MFGNKKRKIPISKGDLKQSVIKANKTLKARNKTLDKNIKSKESELKSLDKEIKSLNSELKSLVDIICKDKTLISK